MQKYHKSRLLCGSNLSILLCGRRQLLHPLWVTFRDDTSPCTWDARERSGRFGLIPFKNTFSVLLKTIKV